MTPEQRLARCARLAMSAWARRWKVIRSDSIEAAEARHCLAEAGRLRDLAREWLKIPHLPEGN